MRIHNFSIRDLTMVLVVLTALVNGFELLSGRIWQHFSFHIFIQDPLNVRNLANLLLFPFRAANNWLELIISLYVFWLFGKHLEEIKGSRWYTGYILVGFFFVILGTYFTPLKAYHVYFSVFLACAYQAPNLEVLLFFVFPVKIKWVALVALFLLFVPNMVVELLNGSLFFFIGPLCALANFLLFFRREIFIRRRLF